MVGHIHLDISISAVPSGHLRSHRMSKEAHSYQIFPGNVDANFILLLVTWDVRRSREIGIVNQSKPSNTPMSALQAHISKSPIWLLTAAARPP